MKIEKIARLSIATVFALTNNLYSNTDLNASLDLETYAKIKIDFNVSSLSSTWKNATADANFTIDNNSTDNNASIYYSSNSGNTNYYTIGEANVSTIRDNTRNDLRLFIAKDKYLDGSYSITNSTNNGINVYIDTETNKTLLIDFNVTFECNLSINDDNLTIVAYVSSAEKNYSIDYNSSIGTICLYDINETIPSDGIPDMNLSIKENNTTYDLNGSYSSLELSDSANSLNFIWDSNSSIILVDLNETVNSNDSRTSDQNLTFGTLTLNEYSLEYNSTFGKYAIYNIDSSVEFNSSAKVNISGSNSNVFYRSNGFPLLTQLGTNSSDKNVSVVNNMWNLIALPNGKSTNANEIFKINKAKVIWGWEYNSGYNWNANPEKMTAGRGYWIKTNSYANNTLYDVMASDYNGTDNDGGSTKINTSDFADIVRNLPVANQWVILGNSTGKDINITTSVATDKSAGKYKYDDLNKTSSTNVDIYHWKINTDTNRTGSWIHDLNTSDNVGTELIPAGAGMWVKQAQ